MRWMEFAHPKEATISLKPCCLKVLHFFHNQTTTVQHFLPIQVKSQTVKELASFTEHFQSLVIFFFCFLLKKKKKTWDSHTRISSSSSSKKEEKLLSSSGGALNVALSVSPA